MNIEDGLRFLETARAEEERGYPNGRAKLRKEAVEWVRWCDADFGRSDYAEEFLRLLRRLGAPPPDLMPRIAALVLKDPSDPHRELYQRYWDLCLQDSKFDPTRV